MAEIGASRQWFHVASNIFRGLWRPSDSTLRFCSSTFASCAWPLRVFRVVGGVLLDFLAKAASVICLRVLLVCFFGCSFCFSSFGCVYALFDGPLISFGVSWFSQMNSLGCTERSRLGLGLAQQQLQGFWTVLQRMTAPSIKSLLDCGKPLFGFIGSSAFLPAL